MKKMKKIISYISCILTPLILIPILMMTACGNKNEDQDISLTFTILQTSDLHNHANGSGPFTEYTPYNTEDSDAVLGGYSRLATLVMQTIEEEVANGVPVLLLDSGDFFMGTVYDLTASDPIALKFFSMMDYDAVTLGNHEFDWGIDGLAMLISNARQSATLPFQVPIVASNMITSETNEGDDNLEALIMAGAITEKKIIQLPYGLKVGILGLIGPEADEKAPLAKPVTFSHDFLFIQGLVDDLRENNGADIVIVLSHSGIETDGTGYDAELAKNVIGIDIIASGHYHTATQIPIKISDTVIFSPGEYGEWLSRLDITYNISQGHIADYEFTLIPVDDTIKGNIAVQEMIEIYNENINLALAPMNLSLASPVSKTVFPLETAPLEENGLGNLAADADRTIASLLVLEASMQAQGISDPNHFSLGVVADGSIRSSLYPGKTGIISFADVYNTLPIGITPDPAQDIPAGSPLMSIYVTAPEIRNICEVSVSLAPYTDPDYYLNFSGIRFFYDESAPPLQRVTNIYLCKNPMPEAYGGGGDIFSSSCDTELDLTDTGTLYRTVVNLFTLHMIDIASAQGLTIVPKNANGEPIDLTDPQQYMLYRIDADNSADGIQELKEWMTLLKFLSQYFPASGEGIPESVYGINGAAMGRVNKISPLESRF